MNIKKLSEVLYTDQPNQNANVIIDNDGSLRKTVLPAGGVTQEIADKIENAQWKNDDRTLLFTETVTAEEDGDQGIATFDYGEPITADTITVTLNGKEYVCPVSVDGNLMTYGAHYDSENMSFNFSEIPFAIDSNESGSNNFYVNEPGTYTVSVTAGAITYTDTFTSAVNDIAGWKTKELKELLSETVTTELDTVSSSAAFAQLSYSDPITADTIIVTFDGTEYVCQKDAGTNQNYYGDSSYTNPPFRIQSNQTEPYRNYVVTKAAGEHTVSIGVEVDACTDDFAKAVNNVAGWKEESTEQLFSETVTTAEPAEGVGFGTATLEYSELIDADVLIVTFDGTDYVCPKTIMNGTLIYGSPAGDFSEYPFAIGSSEAPSGIVNEIYTETLGSHTISASTTEITYTDSFKEGVYQNVLKEVDNDGDADIVVLIPLFSDPLPSETKSCLKLSTSGNPTAYTETEYFGTLTLVLYRSEGAEFSNGNYSYSANSLTRNGMCYYGSSTNEPTVLAFRLQGNVSLGSVSDYYNIKYFAYGLSDAINNGNVDIGDGGGGGGLS